jgi:hypothetical protein
MIVQNIGGMIWNDQLGDMIITTEKDKDIDESDGTENVLPPGHSRYGISLWGGGNHKCNFIFFLNESNYPDNPDKKNHYYRTRFLENSIPSGFMQHGGIGGLIGLYFPDRYELYKYMQQFEGVNVPLSDLKKMERDLSGRPDAWKQYLQDRNMKWGQERNDSIKKDMLEKHEQIKKSAQQNKLKGAKATNYATFIVSNYEQTYDSTETSFLTFDISVSVNNSNAYMFYIAPRIQYNTAAFGSNIVNGGKVTIDTNYINATYQEVFADFDNNLLGIIDLQCYNR